MLRSRRLSESCTRFGLSFSTLFLFLSSLARKHFSSSHCSCRERANREEKLGGIRAIGEGKSENDKGAEKVISEHRGETVGIVVFRGAPRGKKGKARGWEQMVAKRERGDEQRDTAWRRMDYS